MAQPNKDDIVITQADKDGAAVIIDVKVYIADLQPSDTTFYQKLNINLTIMYTERRH